MSESDASADREQPTCPQCGSEAVRFDEDLDGMDMWCDDCDEIVEQWTREHRGGPWNVPGTAEWNHRKASW